MASPRKGRHNRLSTKQKAPRKRIDWVYSTLPVNIALGPIGTYVQLYLLHANGVQQGTVYVTVALSLFSAVSIPAAIVWGIVTDRLRRRRLIIVTGYAITAIYLFSFFFANSTTGVIFVYSLVSFISAASATPLNLLIMETETKSRWATGFARLSLMSSVGSILGYVLSAAWVQFLPNLIVWLMIPLGILSLLSAASAAVPDAGADVPLREGDRSDAAAGVLPEALRLPAPLPQHPPTFRLPADLQGLAKRADELRPPALHLDRRLLLRERSLQHVPRPLVLRPLAHRERGVHAQRRSPRRPGPIVQVRGALHRKPVADTGRHPEPRTARRVRTRPWDSPPSWSPGSGSSSPR